MGRVVVVTGGSNGMGFAIAKRFVDDGEKVVILSRNEGKLRAAADTLGGNAEWLSADVGRRAAVQTAVAEIVRRHRRVDVLGQRFHASNHIIPRRRACKTRCGRLDGD
jgi:NAD(P)-dependent dehydrogenase (short-subunit alcohol dehydrogenase family)